MEEETLFYSPYFNDSKSVNSHCELFPTMDSSIDFTVDSYRDKPSSLWSIRQIGAFQAKYEKRQQMGSYTTNKFKTFPMNDFFSICNEAFGFDGWRTTILDQELTMYEEIDDGNGGLDQDVGSSSDEQEVRYDSDGLIITDSAIAKIRINMEVTTKVRITLKDGTYHESSGSASSYNMPIKALAFGKCKKESASKAIRNCTMELKDVLLEYEHKRNAGFYV